MSHRLKKDPYNLDDTEPDRDIESHSLKKDLVSRQRHSVSQTEERPGKLDDTEPDRDIVSHRLKKDLDIVSHRLRKTW